MNNIFPRKIFGKSFLAKAILILAVLMVGLILALTNKEVPKSTDLPLSPGASSVNPIDALKERTFWQERIDLVGPEPAYTQFKATYANKHFGVQHYVSHIFGEVLYDKTGLKGTAICDATFAFGCYHSFFGRALSEEGTGIIPQLDQACIDKYGPLGTGCMHGIGHGLMEYFGRNKLLDALNACLSTTQKNPLFGCTSGVFMEYNVPIIISSEETRTEFRKLDPDKPHEPCTRVPDQFKKSCYYEMGQWWDKVFAGDYAKLGSLCQTLENLEYLEACYLGIGNVSAPSSNYNVVDTIAKCKLMPNYSSQIICRSGASWSIYAEPKYRSQATEVCADLPSEERDRCVTKADLIGERKNATPTN